MACKCLNDEFAQRTKHTETVGKIQRILEADHRLIWAHRDGERLSSTDEMIPQHGSRYEDSGMEHSKTMVETDVEL